jgi:hypothetical protein
MRREVDGIREKKRIDQEKIIQTLDFYLPSCIFDHWNQKTSETRSGCSDALQSSRFYFLSLSRNPTIILRS